MHPWRQYPAPANAVIRRVSHSHPSSGSQKYQKIKKISNHSLRRLGFWQVIGAVFQTVRIHAELGIGIVPLGDSAHLALMQGIRSGTGYRAFEFAAALDEFATAGEHGMGEARRRAGEETQRVRPVCHRPQRTREAKDQPCQHHENRLTIEVE